MATGRQILLLESIKIIKKKKKVGDPTPCQPPIIEMVS